MKQMLLILLLGFTSPFLRAETSFEAELEKELREAPFVRDIPSPAFLYMRERSGKPIVVESALRMMSAVKDVTVNIHTSPDVFTLPANFSSGLQGDR